ncbi:LOW QUALITY PROTEIN: protein HID1b [Menidia menidia]
MGNSDTKLHFRKAVIQLTTSTQPVEASDEAFWDQFWVESSIGVQDIFALVPAAEIRAVREESPSNLATLCYKVLEEDGEKDSRPLAESLLLAIADLLFCPDFTIQSPRKGPEAPPDGAPLDSCEFIWEAGVGFAQAPPPNYLHDQNRTELLKLLLTCFSEAMYLPPSSESRVLNPWVSFFCSADNRHALPLFTSLLNVVCAYDPVGLGVPYNHLLFWDSRGQLVDQALQVLVVALEHEALTPASAGLQALDTPPAEDQQEPSGPDNLFVNYLSRIHREEDFGFVLKGVARLLNNPLLQTYLPRSTKKIQFHQELLILFWKLCDFNKKFLFFVLKSSDVLEVLVPILFYLNQNRADQARLGLVHIGVFVLLLLSGERNFGVRLNKPFSLRVPTDLPVFTGTHADLLVLIFHKIITGGHQRLQPLFDCLLTVIVNVSPYLKSLSMVASSKLLQLLEAFSAPGFLTARPQNHQLVFFLLEVCNNIIQYQFDGNSNLVYSIIRKRAVFHQLANLPTDAASIQRFQQRRGGGASRGGSGHKGAGPQGPGGPAPPEPGTLKASLEATPGLDKITEKSQVSEDGTMVAVCPPEGPGAEDPEGRCSPSRSRISSVSSTSTAWSPDPDWMAAWKARLPLQTIMRLLQVLVPQVEKICIDKGLTDESEILSFLQHGTLVGLLPVPHPILIRKYQPNAGTAAWFRTYMWGVIYLRNVEPPIWYDTDIRLFEIQRI